MSSENIKAENINVINTGSENNESNLLAFDENNTVSPGKDINKKITALNTDLEQLRVELSAINNSVEEGLDRLGDTDTDLTAKVSETYKRLGEIDNAYKALLQISSRIDFDIQKLNGDVSTVAEQSSSSIKHLEKSSVAQSNEFVQKNMQVASRVNQLVESSKLTSELLNQKITSTTDNLLHVEKSIVAEIESLSNKTKEKSDSLEDSIFANKAKILKLQSVDEAIIRRATTLEISSAELTAKSQHLQASADQLQVSSDMLSTGLHKLMERTGALEELSSRHGTLIGGLKKATSEITDKVTVISDRERKHFNVFASGFLLLLLVTIVIYFVQQDQFDINEMRSVERNLVIDNQMVNLQQEQKKSAVVTNDSMAMLENKIDLMHAVMQNEIKKEIKQIDHTVKNIQDQVQSVDGRFNQASAFSQIGNDNIIHGAHWIADLPRHNFIVQLVYVEDKKTMFEIAQRYNAYLKDSLSYFEVNDNRSAKYVLLLGNYPTRQQAKTAVQALPGRIERQQPVIRKLDTVQKYLAM